jgi:hypothetical protein
VGEVGLRERKKRRTRLHIADAAARPLGKRGYEHASVTDIAEAAELSEQTFRYPPSTIMPSLQARPPWPPLLRAGAWLRPWRIRRR